MRDASKKINDELALTKKLHPLQTKALADTDPSDPKEGREEIKAASKGPLRKTAAIVSEPSAQAEDPVVAPGGFDQELQFTSATSGKSLPKAKQ